MYESNHATFARAVHLLALRFRHAYIPHPSTAQAACRVWQVVKIIVQFDNFSRLNGVREDIRLDYVHIQNTST